MFSFFKRRDSKAGVPGESGEAGGGAADAAQDAQAATRSFRPEQAEAHRKTSMMVPGAVAPNRRGSGTTNVSWTHGRNGQTSFTGRDGETSFQVSPNQQAYKFEVGSRVFADCSGVETYDQTEARVVRRGRGEKENMYEITYWSTRGGDKNLVRRESELEPHHVSGSLDDQGPIKVVPKKKKKDDGTNATCEHCGIRYYSASGNSRLCLECR